MTRTRWFVHLFLLMAFAWSAFQPLSAVEAAGQLSTSQAQVSDRAQALLAGMSPEEKIGQLFLVSFKGTDISETSQIYSLISQYHIGGIVLSAANDNFMAGETLATDTQTMINGLQSITWQTNLPVEGVTPQPSAYIPLMVALSQAGDGAPYDQILSGLTPLPDEMAIGATWNSENARSVGTVLGRELSAMGFNLLLGPSLDVLDDINSEGARELGVGSFGGNAFWVGEMGKAYIKGVHEGSNGRIAVIATHFPGQGESDRVLGQEVGTVRKSLDELVQVELAPFFSVTGNASESLEVTDGLLVSNVRYEGFQGNIRSTTRPISFDSAALNEVLALPDLKTWRNDGGLLVSDNLGTQAIREFFDPLGTSFDARQILKNAFMAGNDLLYLGDIISTGDPDQYTTIQRTLEYFVQKYREDSAFSDQVDSAVGRILTLKLKLYPAFTPGVVRNSPDSLDLLGESDSVALSVAREGVTLINPSKTEIDSVLGNAPQNNERILFIVDPVTEKQCSTCPETTRFSAGSLSDAVVRLYGPSAGEQIQEFRLFTYTFANLSALLEGAEGAGNLSEDMTLADWVVFGFADLGKNAADLEIFRKLFNNRSDLVRAKRLIGFAFNAPYFLDATDISKLTAYYGVYSKNPVFVDTAARVLFQEVHPSGSLPVSVAGAGYDLNEATKPDPTQIIPLMVDTLDQTPLIGTTSPTAIPTTTLTFKVGDTLPIRTGVIRDHNGNPVPDGTVVRFLIDTRSTSGTVEQVETQTSGGIAHTTYKIPSTGLLELKVTAEPAIVSQILRVDITTAGGVITSIEPTPAPTHLPGEEPSPAPTEVVAPIPETHHERGLPDVTDWFVATLSAAGLAISAYFGLSRFLSRRWRVRVAVLMICFGYLVYLVLAIGLPGGKAIIENMGTWVILIGSIVGCILGAAAAATWYMLEKKNTKSALAEKSDQKSQASQH